MNTETAASGMSRLLIAGIAALVLAIVLGLAWVVALVVKFTFVALIHLALLASGVLFFLAAVFFVIWLVGKATK